MELPKRDQNFPTAAGVSMWQDICQDRCPGEVWKVCNWTQDKCLSGDEGTVRGFSYDNT